MRFSNVAEFFMAAGLGLCINQGLLDLAGKVCNYIVYLLAYNVSDIYRVDVFCSSKARKNNRLNIRKNRNYILSVRKVFCMVSVDETITVVGIK